MLNFTNQEPDVVVNINIRITRNLRGDANPRGSSDLSYRQLPEG
jgi:hypothetical protein